MSDIFSPLKMGDFTLPNRILMAPMTRGRSGPLGIPGDIVAQYYAQRASSGLIMTEATAISRQSHGWPGAPGIYNQDQIDGWRGVTDAVHAAGGRIFMQIWHMGRAVLPAYVDGETPVSASPVAAEGQIPDPTGTPTSFPVPRPLEVPEIKAIVNDFVEAAKNAIAAGMDGVEIHAANNFLLDSFLRDGTNTRDDDYGGSPENRARFLLEVTEAVVAEIGAGRVGVRFSPTAQPFGIKDSDPLETFTWATKALNRFGLAYLHLLEVPQGSEHFMASDQPNVGDALRAAFDGPVILSGAYDLDRATATIKDGGADAIAFGEAYIANPDLVDRFRMGYPIMPSDPSTHYTPGPEGYSDYPSHPVAA